MIRPGARVVHALGRAGLGALVSIAACGTDPPPPPATDDSGSTGGSSTGMLSGTTTTTTPPPPTTVATDPMTTAVDSTYGPGCGPDPCPEQCGPDCEPTATCLASVWTCECDCPMTGTEGAGCMPLEDVLDAWVEPSKTPAVDCGVAGPADDVATWQAVHDCIGLGAPGMAFRARWTQPAGEDPFEYGAAARVGGIYELGWFTVTSPNTVTRYACEAIGPTPDCVVDVGQICLTCEGQTEVEIVCEDK